MPTAARVRTYAFYMLTCTVMLFYGTLIAMVEDTAANIPENATERNYGGGWECNAPLYGGLKPMCIADHSEPALTYAAQRQLVQA